MTRCMFAATDLFADLTGFPGHQLQKKLSNVKIISDAIYVAIAVAVDLIFSRRIFTVGVGTVLSVLANGGNTENTLKLLQYMLTLK